MYTDASGYCIEDCLMQDKVLDGIERKRVIAMFRKRLVRLRGSIGRAGCFEVLLKDVATVFVWS